MSISACAHMHVCFHTGGDCKLTATKNQTACKRSNFNMTYTKYKIVLFVGYLLSNMTVWQPTFSSGIIPEH
jgi:hypothetical protein